MDRMMKLAVSCMLALALVGCSGDPEPAATAGGTATPPPAPQGSQTLAIPGTTPAPTGSAAGPLAWDVPEGWVTEQPSSNMRLAQYQVSGPGGDGECIVFYFGPGQGGDPAANATRWAGQFAQPDGSDSTAAMTFGPLEGTAVPVYVVEVTGTYDGGMSGPMDVEGYMLLGGIAEGTDAPWFFKLIGPEETVRDQHAAIAVTIGHIQTIGICIDAKIGNQIGLRRAIGPAVDVLAIGVFHTGVANLVNEFAFRGKF